MINELVALSGILESMHIEQDTWHREYNQLPNATVKAPCYRIWLSDKGAITGIERMAPETVATLRKYGSKQATFPAFNIKPLYRVTEEGQKRENNWLKSMARIDKSLEVIISKFTQAIGGETGGAGPVVMELARSALEMIRHGFRSTLEEYLLTAGAESEIGNILEFAGVDGKAPENDMGANISVIFDLTAWRDYGYPVACEETTRQINAALIRYQAEDTTPERFGAVDAFGDPIAENAKSEPMPEPKLSGFSVKLRSMFNGQPCQQRYGRFDDASYPISKPNRAAAKGALEWVTRPENKRVTWVKADRNEIAFAYPSRLPEIPVPFASMFGDIDSDERFEEVAKGFLKVFAGIKPDEEPEYIRVFSLRKMDRARAKVVFTRNLSPRGFVEAAKRWQLGCCNIPPRLVAEPVVPFPLDAARIVNTVWKRDGTQIRRGDGTPIVRRMQVYQGLELMLGTDDEAYLMSALVSNAFGLIAYAGSERHLSPDRMKKVAETAAMLGLLLYRRGCKKEDYMKDTAFQMGQFLKASDDLHTLYCKIERKGDIPRELVGASMLTTAADAPDKALAQLCLRMDPYLTWAKSYRFKNVTQDGEESWRAAWLVNLFERIAGPLHETFTEPVRFNDFDKAQLFLGYLAAFPKRNDESKADTDLNQSDEGDKNNG